MEQYRNRTDQTIECIPEEILRVREARRTATTEPISLVQNVQASIVAAATCLEEDPVKYIKMIELQIKSLKLVLEIK